MHFCLYDHEGGRLPSPYKCIKIIIFSVIIPFQVTLFPYKTIISDLSLRSFAGIILLKYIKINSLGACHTALFPSIGSLVIFGGYKLLSSRIHLINTQES